MALPNSSIGVTPGSGDTLGLHLLGSLKYAGWTETDGVGQVTGGQGVYVGSQAGAIFPTGDHNLCALWNGSGSGVTLEVYNYHVSLEDAIGDDFNTKNFPRIYRITAAPSAGTTRTPAKLKGTLASLPAQVLFYGEGVTATRTGSPLSLASLWNGATTAAGVVSVFGKFALSHDIPDRETIILAEGEGIVVHGGDNNNVAASGAQALYFIAR